MIVYLVPTEHWVSQLLCFRSSSLLDTAIKRLWVSQQQILQQEGTKCRKFLWWLVSILHLAVDNVVIRLERLGYLRVTFCDVPLSNLLFFSCFIVSKLSYLFNVYMYHRGKAWKTGKREGNCRQVHDRTQVNSWNSKRRQCSLMLFFIIRVKLLLECMYKTCWQCDTT